MDYNLIGDAPLGPGFGLIWQGGAVDAAIGSLPGPLEVVTLDAGELDENFIDHKNVIGELYIGINDSPDAALPDTQLIAHLESGLAYLSRGINLYIHCAAGISRSCYYDVGIHLLQHGDWTYDTALAYIRKFRPQSNPNTGFEAQLRRLVGKL